MGADAHRLPQLDEENTKWQANECSLVLISQTLSETSDIVANSSWNRQQAYDRISEMRSNATLGAQNVASDSGDVYKAPYGYDRYWVDGLGNLYGGSWLSQPDINWQPLQPTGI